MHFEVENQMNFTLIMLTSLCMSSYYIFCIPRFSLRFVWIPHLSHTCHKHEMVKMNTHHRILLSFVSRCIAHNNKPSLMFQWRLNEDYHDDDMNTHLKGFFRAWIFIIQQISNDDVDIFATCGNNMSITCRFPLDFEIMQILKEFCIVKFFCSTHVEIFRFSDKRKNFIIKFLLIWILRMRDFYVRMTISSKNGYSIQISHFSQHFLSQKTILYFLIKIYAFINASKIFSKILNTPWVVN